MFRPGDRVVVAVSGGPDSIALLHLLAEMTPELKLDLHVAHLDHGWRGREGTRDADFVRRTAVRLGVPVTVGRVDPAVWRRRAGRQSSREARARDLRYEFLKETARQIGARRVAVGHTRDDQAESFLLRLLRGSGSRGLGAIHPVVDDLIVRPLLEVRRRDLIAWLRDNHLSYRIDATNRDVRQARNRVRRRLLPLLARDYNPAAVERLARCADLLRDEDAYLAGLAETEFRRLATRRGETLVLTGRELLDLPPAIRRRVVRRALETLRGDLKRITLEHVERTLLLLEDPAGRRSVSLPEGLTASVSGLGLTLARGRGAPARKAPAAGAPATDCREALCPVPGEVALQGFDLRLRASIVPRDLAPPDMRRAGRERAYLDADLLPGPLLIRPRRPGDRFVPLGGPGTRKVKSFLIDRKIPLTDRGRIPLVLSGDRIAWVVGHAIDDRFKVTGTTRRVLVLEKEPR